MATFKQVMDTFTREEMSALCQRYKGLYRFATPLKRLAEGIVPVPQGYGGTSQVGLEREATRWLPGRRQAV
jgi:hypothetical protein